MWFNGKGDTLGGRGGSSRVLINGVIPPPLVDVPAGDWKWIDDYRCGGNALFEGAYEVLEYNVTSGQVYIIAKGGANEFHGGGGNWARYLNAVGESSYLDNLAVERDGVAPLAVGVKGYAFTPLNHVGLTVKYTDREQVITGEPVVEALWRDGVLAYVTPTGVFHDGVLAKTVPGLGVKFTVRPDGEIWLLRWSEVFGTITHPSDSLEGYVVFPNHVLFHGGDIANFGNTLQFVGASNEAESAGSHVYKNIDLGSPRTDFEEVIEPPEVPLKVPAVTVVNWNMNNLHNGREFKFTDSENPELGYMVRVWVEGGSMYAAISNKAGTARTGAFRAVDQ